MKMKRILLLPFLILSATNLWGSADTSQKEIVVEKGDIEVRYKACPPCSIKPFGPTYIITIKNNSTHPILVGPSIINVPLYTDYQEIARVQRNLLKSPLMKTTGAALTGDLILLLLSKKFPEFATELLAIGAAVTLPPLVIYGMMKATELLFAKLMLREPITIKPGKSIHKRFWLKNHDDQVSIDFDAIKVLK